MEEARKRLRVCLICVVALAVLAGAVYYFHDVRDSKNISEGTLVGVTEGSAKWQEPVKPSI